MLPEAIGNAIVALLSENIEGITNWGRANAHKLKEELLVASRRAFSAYYELTREKYGVTKTILYRTSPVPLYDFYVHLLLADPKDLILQTETVTQALLPASHIIISGTAGSGKSTLLKHFFLDALDSKAYLPLFVELRLLNDSPDESLEDFMYSTLNSHNLEISREQFEKLLDGGRFLLLLDAFDELSSPLAKRVEKEVRAFRDRYRRNAIVVSSRPDDRFIGWSNFTEYSVLPLSKSAALELILRLHYDPTIKKSFYSAVDSTLFVSHSSFLENPLLLTLMLMTYDQFGSIPDKMHLFYAQAFDTLYSKHDATKGGYRREMHTNLAVDDFQDILSAFAFLTYLRRQLVLSRPEVIRVLEESRSFLNREIKYDPEELLSDLLRSLCILLQDGLQYVFAHRSFQEYFAARYVIRVSSVQRSAILNALSDRIHHDSVLRLAWEIDRRTVEEDYLIDYLLSVKDRVGSGEFVFREWGPTISFAKLCFSGIHVSEEGTVRYKSSEQPARLFELFSQLVRWYSKADDIDLPWPTPDQARAFLKAVSPLRKGKTTDRRSVVVVLNPDDRVLNADARALELCHIWENANAREHLITMLTPARWVYDSACNALDSMLAQRRSLENSIERLLQQPPRRP